jgi:hypothetical protein
LIKQRQIVDKTRLFLDAIDKLKTPEHAAILATVIGAGALAPTDAEAMYIGPKAKGWDNAIGKFSALFDRMPRAEISDAGAKYAPGRALSKQENLFQNQLTELEDAGILRSFMEKRGVGIGDAKDIFRTTFNREPHDTSGQIAAVMSNRDIVNRLNKVESLSKEKIVRTNLGGLLEHPQLYQQYPEMRDLPVDIRPLDGWTRAQYGQGKIDVSNVTGYGMQEGKKDLLHEIQHAIQEKEGWARGGNPETGIREYKAILRDLLDQIGEINNRLTKAQGTPKYNELLDLRSELTKQVQSIEGKEGVGAFEKGFDQYKRLSGEVEARDTAARMGLSAEERLRTAPYAAQGIDLKDMITKMGGGAGLVGAASLYSPQNAQAMQNNRMAQEQALQEPFIDPSILLAGPAKWGGGVGNMFADMAMKLIGNYQGNTESGI